MTNGPIGERVFTDREVREILKKATAEGQLEAPVSGQGLSLAELKAIGSDVGIPPVRIEEAARSVAQPRSFTSDAIVGAPTKLYREQKVAGRIERADYAQVLSVIRREMGLHGEATEVAGAVEWRGVGPAGERLITVSTDEGIVTVRGSSDLRAAAWNTYGPAGLTSAALTFALAMMGDWASVGEFAVIFALFPVLYLVLRFVLQGVSGSESAKLERTVHEVAKLAREPTDDGWESDPDT